jgi:hypothetical protein
VVPVLHGTGYVAASSTGNGDISVKGRMISYEIRGGVAYANPTATASSTGASVEVGSTDGSVWTSPLMVVMDTLSIRASTTANVRLSYCLYR